MNIIYCLNPFTDLYALIYFATILIESKHMIQCQESHDVSDHIRNEHFLDFLYLNQNQKCCIDIYITPAGVKLTSRL